MKKQYSLLILFMINIVSLTSKPSLYLHDLEHQKQTSAAPQKHTQAQETTIQVQPKPPQEQAILATQHHTDTLTHIQKKDATEEIIVATEKSEDSAQSKQQKTTKEKIKNVAENVALGATTAGAGALVIGSVGGFAAGVGAFSVGMTKVGEIAEDTYGDLKYGAEPELQVEEQGDAS